LPCPSEFEHFFADLEQPREIVKTFVKGESPIIGTTYLTPDFALGSVSRGDLWNQRRSLIAYWGTAQSPAYLHLRFLRDNYDFADAQFLSVQRQGSVLGGVVLATDGGNTHVSLDRITDGTIKARDLRLRFEFGGSAGLKRPSIPEKADTAISLNFGRLNLDLQILFAGFGNEPRRLESGFDAAKGIAWIDVVFYAGDSHAFRLIELEQAAVGFYLRFATSEQPLPGVKRRVHDGKLSLQTSSPDLKLDLPIKPAQVAEIQKRALRTP
jgi:hypothetical protein